MGDPFERRQSSAASRNTPQKFVGVVVLAGVFVVVLAFQFRSLRPRVAQASPDIHAANPVANPLGNQEFNIEAANEAIARLAADPTAELLKNPTERTSPIDMPPKNPFSLAASWQATLLRQVTPSPTTPAEVVRPAPAPTTAYDVSQLKLQAIFKQGQRRNAIVNGRSVSAGAIIAGARIVDVLDDRIICQPLNSPEAARFELPLVGRPR